MPLFAWVPQTLPFALERLELILLLLSLGVFRSHGAVKSELKDVMFVVGDSTAVVLHDVRWRLCLCWVFDLFPVQSVPFSFKRKEGILFDVLHKLCGINGHWLLFFLELLLWLLITNWSIKFNLKQTFSKR
jgi:hypothetical protein